VLGDRSSRSRGAGYANKLVFPIIIIIIIIVATLASRSGNVC
jgi:hypothetical protein